MGMFDYIRCEVPLPDGYEGELQTQDFNCDLATHVITADGRLMLDRGHYESVPKAERPHPNDDGMLGQRGCIRWVPKLEDADFHGYVHFGGMEEIGREPDERCGPRGRPIYRHHDYRAKFTDGQLVGIEIDPD